MGGGKKNCAITWIPVKNEVENRMKENSLVHLFTSNKKIKRRTHLLNHQLKKNIFNLKSYNQYIRLKTAVLRTLSDDEDTEDYEDSEDEARNGHQHKALKPETPRKKKEKIIIEKSPIVDERRGRSMSSETVGSVINVGDDKSLDDFILTPCKLNIDDGIRESSLESSACSLAECQNNNEPKSSEKIVGNHRETSKARKKSASPKKKIEDNYNFLESAGHPLTKKKSKELDDTDDFSAHEMSHNVSDKNEYLLPDMIPPNENDNKKLTNDTLNQDDINGSIDDDSIVDNELILDKKILKKRSTEYVEDESIKKTSNIENIGKDSPAENLNSSSIQKSMETLESEDHGQNDLIIVATKKTRTDVKRNLNSALNGLEVCESTSQSSLSSVQNNSPTKLLTEDELSNDFPQNSLQLCQVLDAFHEDDIENEKKLFDLRQVRTDSGIDEDSADVSKYGVETANKKVNLKITCTEVVTSKYTIIREAKSPSIQFSQGYSSPNSFIGDSQEEFKFCSPTKYKNLSWTKSRRSSTAKSETLLKTSDETPDKSSPKKSKNRSSEKFDSPSPTKSGKNSPAISDNYSLTESKNNSTAKSDSPTLIKLKDISPRKPKISSSEEFDNRSPTKSENIQLGKSDNSTPEKLKIISSEKSGSPSPTKSENNSPEIFSSPSPEKSIISSPEKSDNPSPRKYKNTSPAKSDSASPTKLENSSPEKSDNPSSIKYKNTSPAKSDGPSPKKSNKSSPEKRDSPSPTKSENSSPEKSDSPFLAKSKSCLTAKLDSPSSMKSNNISPRNSKKGSPEKSDILSPTKSQNNSPAKSDSPSPTKSGNSPEKFDTPSPTKSQNNSPAKSGSLSPRMSDNISTANSDNCSPTKIGKELPAKSYSSLLVQSPNEEIIHDNIDDCENYDINCNESEDSNEVRLRWDGTEDESGHNDQGSKNPWNENNLEEEELEMNCEKDENHHRSSINNNSSNLRTKKSKNSISTTATESESLNCVLRNLTARQRHQENINDHREDGYNIERELIMHEKETELLEPSTPEPILPRPTNLLDFVERSDLELCDKLPTFTLSELTEDDDLFIMEVPKMIFEQNLKGQRLKLKKRKLIIGDTKFHIERRSIEPMSFVLNTGSTRKPYKTGIVRPLANIVVARKSTNDDRTEIGAAEEIIERRVPFPINLKSRNPLMLDAEKPRVSESIEFKEPNPYNFVTVRRKRRGSRNDSVESKKSRFDEDSDADKKDLEQSDDDRKNLSNKQFREQKSNGELSHSERVMENHG